MMRVTARVLNVRSGPGTDFTQVRQLSAGDLFDVDETRGDWAYSQRQCGWVHRAYIADTSFPILPVGHGGLVTQFGPPGAPACSAGRVVFPAPVKLGWASASVVRAACHIRMEELFTRVFRDIHEKGLWTRIVTFDGIYNDRPTKSGKKRSTHAWGISVDINARTNAQGHTGDMPNEIVEVFEAYKFVWGGTFSGNSVDPMHFQYARDY